MRKPDRKSKAQRKADHVARRDALRAMAPEERREARRAERLRLRETPTRQN